MVVVTAARDGVVEAPILHEDPANEPQVRQEPHRAEHRSPPGASALAQQAVHGEMVPLLQDGGYHSAARRRHPIASGLQAEGDVLKGRDDTWYH